MSEALTIHDIIGALTAADRNRLALEAQIEACGREESRLIDARLEVEADLFTARAEAALARTDAQLWRKWTAERDSHELANAATAFRRRIVERFCAVDDHDKALTDDQIFDAIEEEDYTETAGDMMRQRLYEMEQQLAAEKAALVKPLVDLLVKIRGIITHDANGYEACDLIDAALALYKPCPTCKGTRQIRSEHPLAPLSTMMRPCPDCAGEKKGD